MLGIEKKRMGKERREDEGIRAQIATGEKEGKGMLVEWGEGKRRTEGISNRIGNRQGAGGELKQNWV